MVGLEGLNVWSMHGVLRTVASDRCVRYGLIHMYFCACFILFLLFCFQLNSKFYRSYWSELNRKGLLFNYIETVSNSKGQSKTLLIQSCVQSSSVSASYIQWWFVPDTFVPRRYFRINEFSGLLNRPLVQTWKLAPTLLVQTSKISGLSEPGWTNHHCRWFMTEGWLDRQTERRTHRQRGPSNFTLQVQLTMIKVPNLNYCTKTICNKVHIPYCMFFILFVSPIFRNFSVNSTCSIHWIKSWKFHKILTFNSVFSYNNKIWFKSSLRFFLMVFLKKFKNIKLMDYIICGKNQGVFVKHWLCPRQQQSPKKAIFSAKVKVTRSLTLVSFERASLVEYACQIWSLYL